MGVDISPLRRHYAGPMRYVKFSIRIPRIACAPLDAEAASEERNRTQMIIKILKERYGVNLPDSNTTPARASPRPKAKQKKSAVLN